jgi:hypothetical protein
MMPPKKKAKKDSKEAGEDEEVSGKNKEQQPK